MKYTNKTFSVGGGGSKEYADGWERIFGNADSNCINGVCILNRKLLSLPEKNGSEEKNTEQSGSKT